MVHPYGGKKRSKEPELITFRACIYFKIQNVYFINFSPNFPVYTQKPERRGSGWNKDPWKREKYFLPSNLQVRVLISSYCSDL